MKKRTPILWLFWIAATVAACAAFAGMAFVGGDRSMLTVGKLTGAHYQFELSCESCHAGTPFSSDKKMENAMNKACLNCHKKELKVSNDSHPIKKFRDPRNADRLEQLNAKMCVTCHMEHKPEITRASAVTLPMNYCIACHQDVGKNRPSHVGLTYETCASAGCHNFHDNRALYEDFLVKHAKEPDFAETPIQKAAAELRAPYQGKPGKHLSAGDAIAPKPALETSGVVAEWAASVHAAAGVNCAGCHAAKLRGKKSQDLALVTKSWKEKPEVADCASCHRGQTNTFSEGKHGGRQHPKMAKPRKPPEWAPSFVAALFADKPLPAVLKVGDARQPMRIESHEKTAGACSSCHAPHKPDKRRDAVEACVGCHDDGHTQSYFASPHYALWQNEISGTAPVGSGVACADCHMPKIEDENTYKFFTTHNQNSYLRPNEKMIRPVCMNCHGLAFSIDALADPALVANNFNGHPARHIESIDWAVKRVTEKKPDQ